MAWSENPTPKSAMAAFRLDKHVMLQLKKTQICPSSQVSTTSNILCQNNTTTFREKDPDLNLPEVHTEWIQGLKNRLNLFANRTTPIATEHLSMCFRAQKCRT